MICPGTDVDAPDFDELPHAAVPNASATKTAAIPPANAASVIIVRQVQPTIRDGMLVRLTGKMP
jgi:hypothetical protein